MSASKQNARAIALTSTADQSANQYCFQAVDTANDKSCVIAGAGVQVIGSLGNKPKAGEAASIEYDGEIEVIAGAQVTDGARVMSDASGHAIPWTAGNYSPGIATSTASAGPNLTTGENQLISVLWQPLYA